MMMTTKERADYERALGILHRMSLERTGWRGWFRRWAYNDEPLRHDAGNLINEVGYSFMQPYHTRNCTDALSNPGER